MKEKTKTEKNILVAFILNIAFSIFELVGGFFTNSVAILSDAVHDFGDALSIGISYFLEKKSKQKPDSRYTYGYIRYSILGAFITTTILITGSVIVIIGAVQRIINPVEINYDGMIIFAIVGVVVNFIAAYFTREGDSINQRSVNLHMLEDVLGWVVVLIGSILMKFTDISLIDSIMSIAVSTYILFHSMRNLKAIVDLFLEKTPKGISIKEIKNHLSEIGEILDVHHIHVWSLDGYNNYATLHIKTGTNDLAKLKSTIRKELKEHGINHVTIEIEGKDDECNDENCKVHYEGKTHSHHHHH